jgi:hypothetical protein
MEMLAILFLLAVNAVLAAVIFLHQKEKKGEFASRRRNFDTGTPQQSFLTYNFSSQFSIPLDPNLIDTVTNVKVSGTTMRDLLGEQVPVAISVEKSWTVQSSSYQIGTVTVGTSATAITGQTGLLQVTSHSKSDALNGLAPIGIGTITIGGSKKASNMSGSVANPVSITYQIVHPYPCP